MIIRDDFEQKKCDRADSCAKAIKDIIKLAKSLIVKTSEHPKFVSFALDYYFKGTN